jgi:3-hydroxyacyl-CoA dehydrogenase
MGMPHEYVDNVMKSGLGLRNALHRTLRDRTWRHPYLQPVGSYILMRVQRRRRAKLLKEAYEEKAGVSNGKGFYDYKQRQRTVEALAKRDGPSSRYPGRFRARLTPEKGGTRYGTEQTNLRAA